MNGAQLLFQTAVEAGVDVCFANPGTTEMELVAAVDQVPGMRAVLGLFEGVVTGAADGYGRVTGTPALTLTHLGPGFANGIANLHNARRAHTPVINVIGDHATWHLDADAPLTTDIESLARPVSKAVFRLATATHTGAIVTEAIASAMGPPSGVATIIVPQDCAWGAADLHDLGSTEEVASPVDLDAVAIAATRLREEGSKVGILLGGVVRRDELVAAERIRAATGATVWIDTFPAVLESGLGLPRFDAVPYFPEQAIAALDGLETLICAGTRPPVAFFGYRSLDRSDLLSEACEALTLVGPGARGSLGLDALVSALECPEVTVADRPALAVPTGDLDLLTLGAAIAAVQPEGAIVVNEAATSGLGWAMSAASAPPHESFSLTGGAIGFGLPAAVGAAVAAPDRKVIAFQADGSGLYTAQALWTMARESLDVTVVVAANRAYRILQMELHRTGHDDAGPQARSLTDLTDPAPDWVSLAAGYGVPAVRATTLEELLDGLARGLASPGPFLVEAVIAG